MASLAMAVDIRAISNLKSSEGRVALGKGLGISVEDEEKDLKASILLDYLYDNLQFALKKGFSWDQCLHVVLFAKELLEDSTGKTLADAVQLYREKCVKYQEKIPSQKLLVYSEFIFGLLMTHFNLYQYVFTRGRAKASVKHQVTVEVPPETENFSATKPEHIWVYEQKVKHLEEVLEHRKEERTSQHKQGDIQQIYNDMQLEPPIEDEQMRLLVSKVAKAHLSAASQHLSQNISDTMQDLELLLQKMAIPRPTELETLPEQGSEEEDDALADLGMSFDKVKVERGRKSSMASQGPSRTKSRFHIRLQSQADSRSQSSLTSKSKKKLSSISRQNSQKIV